MRKTLFAQILLVMCLFTAVSLIAGNIDFSEYRPMTNEEFVMQAIDKDTQFSLELQNYLKAKYTHLSAQAIKSWSLGSSIGNTHVENISGNIKKTDSNFYEFNVQKLFLLTGTRFQISHTNIFSTSEYKPTQQDNMLNQLPPKTSADIDNSSPEISISLVQPLLKNALGLADKFPLQIAELEEAAAKLDVQEAWEKRIAELFIAYFSWTAAYENVLALQEIVTEIRKLEEQVERKVEARVAERSDLLLTRSNVLQYQRTLLEAEGAYTNEMFNIITLGLDREMLLRDITKIKPVIKENIFKLNFETQPADEVALEKLRILKKMRLLHKQLLLNKKKAENAKLVDINFVGEYTLKGNSDDKKGGYDNLEKNNYNLMLQATYPLGNQQAKGELKRVKTEIEELNYAILTTKQSLKLALKQMEERIFILNQVLVLFEEQLANAKEKLALDIKDYKIGRLDTRYLIESQNAVTNARLQKVQTIIELHKITIEYLSLTDSILKCFPEISEKLK